MIIGCPSCRTRYLVDEQALGGRTGRTVRCATCGHTWHQAAPPELPAGDNLARFEGSRIEPALEVPPRPGAARAPSLGVPPRPGAARVPSLEVPPRAGAASELRLPSSRRRWAAVRWLVLFVLLALAVLAGVVVARGAVVAVWPPAARLFALAGWPVEPPWAGLKIEKLAPTRTAGGLVIEGEIANPGKTARDVPRLRVALRDVTEKEVQFKIIDPPKPRLAPGAVAHFTTPFEHPDSAATGVVVTFATR
jgi:predicted Zn finger-like uncharacterized protein